MASYINVFLKKEMTVIPRLLDKYIGKYYNNTLCNGATWMFLLWYILHVIFDDLLNALLRKMKYKEYMRIRLKKSLWYLGFYSTACVYCIATFLRNDISFYGIKTPFDSTNTPSGHLILGFIVLSTFYLHSAFWERLKYDNRIIASNYLCLFLLLCSSYFLRFVEGTFRLTILICCTQIALELARCSAVLINRKEYGGKFVNRLFFASSIVTFILNYLIIISLLLDPLIRKLTPSALFLTFFLLIWLTLEIYDSVLFKTVVHWVNHRDKFNCKNDMFECALFPPRNDATYNFLILRKEIKEREEKYLSLRRPKNRNMVVQTLKCMVAIKRKLNEKRQSTNVSKDDNSISSDTVSQKSESEQGNEQNDDGYANSNENVGEELKFDKKNNAEGDPRSEDEVILNKALNIRVKNDHLMKSSNGYIGKCKED